MTSMERARYKSQKEAVKHLRIGDIVLFSRKKGLLSLLIGNVTQSHWTHVALVFHISHISAFPPDVLLVEATDQGISVHRLDTYLNQPEVYELGFKRMKGLTKEERERFRGFFLDAVDTPYDYRRLKSWLLHHYFERLTGRSYQHFLTKAMVNTNNFVCTTFAQRAYFLAVSPKKRAQIFFRDQEEDDVNFLERMELVTPRDIAVSKNAVWLYNPQL